jgi:sirohydrochlorin ferrochelatase
MNALLIVAHGSRSPDTEIDISLLIKGIKDTSNDFDMVEHAYLEIASPKILESIENLIGQQAQYITVLPYFLSRGNHVNNDVPNVIKQAQDLHPNIDIKLLPHIGASSEMAEFVATHVMENN